MPIVEPAELLGHITTEDGRKIPHYKVKTETTILAYKEKSPLFIS